MLRVGLARGVGGRHVGLRLIFSINLQSIPVVSFEKVAARAHDVIASLKDKNVIVGVVAANVLQTVPVPRYGNLQRGLNCWLSRQNGNSQLCSKTIPIPIVALCTMVFVLPLGRYLHKSNALFGPVVALLTIAAFLLCSLVLQSEYCFVMPMMLPVASIVFTLIGSLVATILPSPVTRKAVQMFLGRLIIVLQIFFKPISIPS